MTLILPTSYFPNVEYFNKLLNAEQVLIQINEVFPKQTFRNRCVILNANGIQQLSVPLQREHGSETTTPEIRISYAENWIKNHLKSFESAYKNAAYYEYYIDRITEILNRKIETLPELNFELLQFLTDKIGLSCELKMEKSNEKISDEMLAMVNPKIKSSYSGKKYYQTFSERFEFQNNLSVLDLLFNEGPNAISVLHESESYKL